MSAIVMGVGWEVVVTPDAEVELSKVPSRERVAVDTALVKLRELGPHLGFPHTSAVVGADRLREVRPRRGRCPWRAFYRQIGAYLVIAAVGPEAQVDRRGFQRAVAAAEARLAEIENEEASS
jgi:hypothetical protein